MDKSFTVSAPEPKYAAGPFPKFSQKRILAPYPRAAPSLGSEPILLCLFDNFFFLQLLYCIIISPSFLSYFHQHANIPPFNKCSLDPTLSSFSFFLLKKKKHLFYLFLAMWGLNCSTWDASLQSLQWSIVALRAPEHAGSVVATLSRA